VDVWIAWDRRGIRWSPICVDRSAMRRVTATIVVLILTSPTVSGGPDARKAFAESWRGKHVAVRKTLYTLVYNERGKLAKVYHDKREGLLVATPSAGTYFQFDGRDSEVDIVGRDAQQVIDRIGEMYRRSNTLEIGFYLRIEPLLVVTYPPGGTLVVKDLSIERNRVRVSFASTAGDVPPDQLATALTIQWPTDVSPVLTERSLVEALIRQFVDDRVETRTESRNRGLGIGD
jgi:hypothetical protein